MEKQIDLKKADSFILGGEAILTAKSLLTHTHYTYRVTVPANEDKEKSKIFFVAVLTGSDNTKDYTYIGNIKIRNDKMFFESGRKSRISKEAPSVVAIDFVINKILSEHRTSNTLELWHEGYCCRCGCKLTTPESVESGIGPVCAGIKAENNI